MTKEEKQSRKDALRVNSCVRESDAPMQRKACGIRMTNGLAVFSENFFGTHMTDVMEKKLID